MIDGDDGTSLADALGVDLDGRGGEGRVDVVNRDGVVGVCRAARYNHKLEGLLRRGTGRTRMRHRRRR